MLKHFETETIWEGKFSTEPPFDFRKAWHDLWREIHTKQDPTQEWWDSIVKKVSSYFCSCGDFLRDYVATNQPRFDDWFAYSWELHNAVNEKLGKPQLPIEEAKAIW